MLWKNANRERCEKRTKRFRKRKPNRVIVKRFNTHSLKCNPKRAVDRRILNCLEGKSHVMRGKRFSVMPHNSLTQKKCVDFLVFAFLIPFGQIRNKILMFIIVQES